MNRLTPEKERQIVELYRAGKTYREIEECTGANPRQVSAIVDRMGLPRRPQYGSPERCRTRPCAHCGETGLIRGRGLCDPCYDRQEIREQYPTTRADIEEPEPTEEEIEATIEEQMQCLPSWWYSEFKLAEVGCQAGSRKKRQAQ